MRKIIAALAFLLFASGVACSASATKIDVSGLSEASMSFDQDGVGPFLHELSGSVSTNLDADALKESIDALPVETVGNWEFSATLNGKRERLVVVAFKDDVDAPDLAFYTSPELAAKVQQQLESFAQAQGW
ncbi:hypothetical protein [Xanthomonas sp. BRIP62418]|uniref:hypothetical protein n=1 Tax=Xanthomonas sp. BRIP62418 TaxID=2182391 RepID=UPI000F8E30B3|nr:hypothetical protein [Xanthomonas sp. BRIP62418]